MRRGRKRQSDSKAFVTKCQASLRGLTFTIIMSTPAKVRAIKVCVSDDSLTVDLDDSRTISVPMGWYPRLAHATPEERNNYRLVGNGIGIHHVIVPTSFVPSDVPRGFVRLVYCLGYGENWLLNHPINNPSNTGTLQFWKIFYRCINPVQSNRDFSKLGHPCATRDRNGFSVSRNLHRQGSRALPG